MNIAERIWAARVTDSYGEWQTVKYGLLRPVEYVRADKLEELAAENHEHLRRNAELNREMSGVRRSYSQEKSLRIKAEAALAEAKRENEAMQKQVMMLGVQLDDMMFLSVEGFLGWQNEQKEARNAGGNDEPCRGCGDGDKVPASGYWRCPVCDAEWSGEDAE